MLIKADMFAAGGEVTPRFETETAAKNVTVSKVIKNGYYVNKQSPATSETIIGFGHIIDGVFTSDFLSSWGSASYDNATNTLTVANTYAAGLFYFYIID